MTDQISRQKLIEKISKLPILITEDDDFVDLDAVLYAINSQPPADQWIPISDTRKPTDGQRVVVTTNLWNDVNFVGTATYYTEMPKGWWEYEWEGEGFYQSHECGWCRREDVTAWFYTEPYKEGEKI